MKKHLLFLLFISTQIAFCQEKIDSVLTLEEYIGFVKKFHPVVKQARLVSSEGESKLLKARGAFDPKIAGDYSRKNFKNKEYYDKINATFKIPTWYGIELKANYENNDGIYLNPESNTPEEGLYSAGISLSLAKGLLINERMATLKQAKLYTKQAAQKQRLLINKIVFKAVNTYFLWLKNYQTLDIYNNYVINAETRLQNVKKSYEAGDKPAVDTLEASINLKSRILDLEKAKLGYRKSILKLSNYLWLANNIPLEVTDSTIPDTNTVHKIDTTLKSSLSNALDFSVENHPKIKELELKKQHFILDKKLKLNNLLPQIDFQYNFLNTNYRELGNFNTANYKNFLQVSFPIFLRKERADLKLTKLKIKETDFDISSTKIIIKNKIKETITEISSYEKQQGLMEKLVKDYQQLVKSEERKFELGEGSLFLINYREVKFIENQIKFIDTRYKYLLSKSSLFNTLNSFSL